MRSFSDIRRTVFAAAAGVLTLVLSLAPSFSGSTFATWADETTHDWGTIVAAIEHCVVVPPEWDDDFLSRLNIRVNAHANRPLEERQLRIETYFETNLFPVTLNVGLSMGNFTGSAPNQTTAISINGIAGDTLTIPDGGEGGVVRVPIVAVVTLDGPNHAQGNFNGGFFRLDADWTEYHHTERPINMNLPSIRVEAHNNNQHFGDNVFIAPTEGGEQCPGSPGPITYPDFGYDVVSEFPEAEAPEDELHTDQVTVEVLPGQVLPPEESHPELGGESDIEPAEPANPPEINGGGEGDQGKPNGATAEIDTGDEAVINDDDV